MPLQWDWRFNCGPVQEAYRRKDWAWIAGWVSARFGVSVSATWAKENRPLGRDVVWSDGSWSMYWKTQIIKDDLFEKPGGRPARFEDLKVPMHVFFLHLEETDEMLTRLRNDNTVVRSGPSTPGIERTVEKPVPVDRVAGRVSHFPPPGDRRK